MKDAIKYIKENNHNALVRYLAYNDINMQDEYKNTLLHYTIIYDKPQLSYFLIEQGINLNILNNNLMTPLYLAIHMNRINIVIALLKNKADISILGENNNSAFFHACRLGRREIINLFLEYNEIDYTLNSFNEDFYVALIKSEQFDLIEKYYDKRTFDTNKNGNTLLHYAASTNERIIKFFVNKGYLLNIRNNAGQTPLDFAILSNKEDNIKCLLLEGSLAVIGKNSLDYVKYAKYDQTEIYKKKFPLHYYIYLLDFRSIIKVIGYNNVKQKDEYGNTPLKIAQILKNKELLNIIKRFD